MNQTIFENKQRPGNVLTSNWMNDLVRQIFARIVAGDNIKTQTLNDNIIISSTASGNNNLNQNIPIVATLPEIPAWDGSVKIIRVYWGNSSKIDGGTGDNQIWESTYGSTKFHPTEKFSIKSGTPVQ